MIPRLINMLMVAHTSLKSAPFMTINRSRVKPWEGSQHWRPDLRLVMLWDGQPWSPGLLICWWWHTHTSLKSAPSMAVTKSRVMPQGLPVLETFSDHNSLPLITSSKLCSMLLAHPVFDRCLWFTWSFYAQQLTVMSEWYSAGIIFKIQANYSRSRQSTGNLQPPLVCGNCEWRIATS